MKFKYTGNNISIENMILIEGQEYEIEDEKKFKRIYETLKPKIEILEKIEKKSKKKEVEENDR